MKVIILAAGYATRLYPLTLNTPKPLLKVAGKTIVEHLIAKIEQIPDINQIYIVTNNKFYDHFQEWKNNFNSKISLKIVNDKTTCNEDRLGAVGDINFVVKNEKINNDLLVIAGDNLFDFSLVEYVNFYQNLNRSGVAFRDLKDKELIRNKFGVGVMAGTKIIDFEEKPAEPKSTLASTACYFFIKDDLKLIGELVNSGKVDNSGEMIKWLIEKSEAHAFVFNEQWFDIGGFEQLEEAEQFYSRS